MEKIKVVENTELAQHFTALERASYEEKNAKFLIEFIISHPELKENFDFYWGKYIDKQINYEKEKQSFSNYIAKEFSNDKISWFADFGNGTVEITE